MASPLRLEFAGALYHVTARGNRRGMIYEDDSDRLAFLERLSAVCTEENSYVTLIACWVTTTSFSWRRPRVALFVTVRIISSSPYFL
ncbi:hypothetical protein A3724_12810 [Alcanivorax sp. HI0033]|nr:hypothetical protein A3713_05135 [Alcanivorax sp. HI0003]KZX66307.1 hypothetical protein A3714_13545 [Alcanivorax sp. HI0007]KZX73365.1 hypothetical protein A3717_15850 [Alcanivorax sp. HI0013]KZX78777.1 hypothetical protein A3716_18455 [Alcanivorax sp. HI0011]KZY06971.1 hypothetical protein A3725_15910 [Alcanivorax sp. HI0035]KZY11180.1 hypothetical protein A3724_12810 [Alcanivorax sp. HI0033]